MSNIRVDVNFKIFDGAQVSFKSPANFSDVTGLRVCYPETPTVTKTQDFSFTDAHGVDVTDLDDLFGESAIVKVLLDTVHSRAFVQNADTNSYLERRFEEISYSPATQSEQGLMSAADKKKLDGVATNAEVNQNAFSNVKVGNTTIAADSKTDTLTVAAGSNVSITPDATNDTLTISATDTTYSAATQSANGLLSASDKKKLDGIATGANAYVHPSASGNKHIPSGGSSGQILRWGADGTAVWGSDNNTTYNPVTQSANGLMSAADKKKLDGIATGANAYSHPTTSGNKHIPSGGADTQILTWSADGTAKWADHNQIHFMDTRNVNTPPSDVPVGLSLHLKNDGTAGMWDGGHFQPTLMLKPYWDKSGGPFGQIALTANNNLWFRTSHINSDTEWKAWRKVVTNDLVMMLIWENSNVTQSFGNSYINLSGVLPHFRNFVVVFNEGTSNTYAHSVVVHKSQNFKMQLNEFYNGATINFERAVWIDDGTLAFGHAYYNGVEDNSRVIPYKVYGLI